MDEMLSMALWIMIAFMTVSSVVVWMAAQPGFPTGLGLVGVTDSNLIDANAYTNISCSMNSLFEAPGYAICFLNQLTTPILGVVSGIWKLLTSWTNLLHAIFISVPAGDLFESILTPFLIIIEIGAAIVILMRLAAIVRGVAGGFL